MDRIQEIRLFVRVVDLGSFSKAAAEAGIGQPAATKQINRMEQQLGARLPEKIVLVGTAASRFAVAPIAPDLHTRTLVLHGEQDDTVSLASVMDWARPQSLPVTVVPGVEHFFHGQLPLLKSLVLRHLLAPLVP